MDENENSEEKEEDNYLDELKSRLYESWEKIFDLERERDERLAGKKEEQSI